MFRQTYKNTIKNLLRSPVFWFILIVLVFTVMYDEYTGHFGGDTDPTFVLSYQNFVQTMTNITCAAILFYPLPIFTTFTVVLILNRDYGDKFYEIEKCGGLRPSTYILGRLAALVSVNFVVLVLLNITASIYYTFSRGGVEGHTAMELIKEILIRTIRLDIFVAMPTVLFYIGITYLVGALFKNGIPAAVTSIGYVIAFYMGFLMFRFRVDPLYFDYLSPVPWKLRQYFHYYQTEWWSDFIVRNDLSIGKVAICIAFLSGVGIVGSLIAYLCTRKRNV